MKPVENNTRIHFAISDSKRVASETKRMKKILEANYEKADLNKIVDNLKYLDKNKQSKLLKLLKKYEPMFDRALGKYTGSTYKIELKDNIKPVSYTHLTLPTNREV